MGAAWGGDPLVDRQAGAKAAKLAETADSAGDLGQLARKQGMNTDIRRSIFVVLMSSDVCLFCISLSCLIVYIGI